MANASDSKVPQSPTEPIVRLRLYVLGGTFPSEQALVNLQSIAKEHLAGRYELEVVDVRDEPLRALNDGAVMIPTLVLTTAADHRVIGNLSDAEAVLKVLGLPGVAKSHGPPCP